MTERWVTCYKAMRDRWSPQQLVRLPETTRGLLIYKIHSLYVLYFVFMCIRTYFNFILYIIGAYKLQHQNAAVRIIIYNTVKSLGSNSANLANYRQFAKLFANFYNFHSIAYRFMFTCLPIGAIKASWLTMWPLISDHIFSSSIATYITCSMLL